MKFEEMSVLYIFRPPPRHNGQRNILQKLDKLKKQCAGISPNKDYKDSIPQIRDYFEEVDKHLQQKGKWWNWTWTRYDVKYEDLENAFLNGLIETQFYRNLLVIRFSPNVIVPLRQALFFKAQEMELEVIPE